MSQISLEARAVRFAYRGAPALFDSWEGAFRQGEVVALTGPSGSGKSTLLYMLGLMLKPHSGDIQVLGAPTSALSDRDCAAFRAHHFGFVFQDAALDPSRSVIDNVVESSLYRGTSRKEAIRRGRALLEQFGVDHREDHKPGQVSGGQAQRIALCRALLHEPPILVADEPTGNLDRDSADTVIGAFHQRAELGATVIIATHDAAVVERCSRKIEL